MSFVEEFVPAPIGVVGAAAAMVLYRIHQLLRHSETSLSLSRSLARSTAENVVSVLIRLFDVSQPDYSES